MRPFQCSTAGRSPSKGAMSNILSVISTLIFGYARSGVRDNLSGGLHTRGLGRGPAVKVLFSGLVHLSDRHAAQLPRCRRKQAAGLLESRSPARSVLLLLTPERARTSRNGARSCTRGRALPLWEGPAVKVCFLGLCGLTPRRPAVRSGSRGCARPA